MWPYRVKESTGVVKALGSRTTWLMVSMGTSKPTRTFEEPPTSKWGDQWGGEWEPSLDRVVGTLGETCGGVT